MNIKICGITSSNDAQKAVECGASAIGLIFYKKSPRSICIELAKNIASNLDGKVPLVGVFVNECIDRVKLIASLVPINIIQLHGEESPEYCKQLNYPVIKVFKINNNFDSQLLESYDVDAYLFDTYRKGLAGGTGEKFNWDLIKKIKSNTPFILSGGLTLDNAMEGVKTVNPLAIDVNSGVEESPGEKDHDKIESLFRAFGYSNSNIFKEMIGKNV